MAELRKCAIIGCGQVGASCAYAFMQSGLFTEMVLIDVNYEKAEGEAMDLNHGLPFRSPMKIYAGKYSDISDAYIIVIAAGANQKEGESRLELLSRNAKIMKSITDSITEYNKDAILLVVSNPVDILTYMILHFSGYPAQRVIGSGTVLDTARLKYLVGRKLDVDNRNVHTFIIGEHGDSELAVWSSANISGIDIADYVKVSGKCKDMECLYPLYYEVRDSAYNIIKRKGATYYAIAEAVLRIAECIVRDEHSVLSVSTLCDGHYGIDDICIGVPSVVGRQGVEKVLDIPLDDYEKLQLQKSVYALSELIDTLDIKKAQSNLR
ncbi:MAG: L-lactate dehydrogenase [Clostridia bacterium]|nr:L-lactate dehydrogenase [Clostridia bacterium]